MYINSNFFYLFIVCQLVSICIAEVAPSLSAENLENENLIKNVASERTEQFGVHRPFGYRNKENIRGRSKRGLGSHLPLYGDILQLKEDSRNTKFKMENIEKRLTVLELLISGLSPKIEQMVLTESDRCKVNIEEKLSQMEQFQSEQYAELSNKNSQLEHEEERKFAEVEAKLNAMEQKMSEQYTNITSTIKENSLVETRKFTQVEDKSNVIEKSISQLAVDFGNRIKQSELIAADVFDQIKNTISEQCNDLSAQINETISLAVSNKFEDAESKFVRIEELVSQHCYCPLLTNSTQKNSPDENTNTSNLIGDGKQNKTDEPIIEEFSSNNRIADGPAQCRLWPNGKVPYELDTALEDHTRKYIDEAISDFHEKTCVRWIPRQSERGYVRFGYGNSTDSNNQNDECYTGGRQMSILRHEFTPKEIIRKMAYILGFGDEHLRNDRDEYIELKRSNCTMAEKYPHLNGGGFYDYQSIMHPTCGQETCLQYKYHTTWFCGTIKRLSALDADKLFEMYKCGGCHSLRFRFPNNSDFSASGTVPEFENSPQEKKDICRVYKRGQVRIGRGNAQTGECRYLLDTHEMTTENVQFLTNPNQAKLLWVEKGVIFPPNAVIGGTDAVGATLYISRCRDELSWAVTVESVPTYSDARSKRMYEKNGREHICSYVEILTCVQEN